MFSEEEADRGRGLMDISADGLALGATCSTAELDRGKILNEIARNPSVAGLEFLDGAWTTWSDLQSQICLSAVWLHRLMTLEQATLWAGRARWTGAFEDEFISNYCPLSRISGDPSREMVDRFIANSRLASLFDLDKPWEWLLRRMREANNYDLIESTRSALEGEWPPLLAELDRLLERSGTQLLDYSEIGASWTSPLFSTTGYGDEARGFLRHLRPGRLRIMNNGPNEAAISTDLLMDDKGPIARGISVPEADLEVSVLHSAVFSDIMEVSRPGHLGDYAVLRTMFETDGMPEGTADRVSQFDEVWVPTKFNVESFTNAGVTAPLYRVPGGIEVERYSVRPTLLGTDRTRFLSIFEWQMRKGWQTLVEAWAMAFTRDDPVELLIKSYRLGSGSSATSRSRQQVEIYAEIRDFLIRGGFDPARVASIEVDTSVLDEAAYQRMLALADVYVCPSFGEGWGRPYMESMASGIPTIATNWSGQTEFMNPGNSYLVALDGVVACDPLERNGLFRGQNWAHPSVTDLARILREVQLDHDSARDTGLRARRDVELNWTWAKAAEIADRRLSQIETLLKGELLVRQEVLSRCSTQGVVLLKGDFFAASEHSRLNVELLRHYVEKSAESSPIMFLEQAGTVKRNPRRCLSGVRMPLLSLVSPTEPSAVEIRHQWPLNLSASKSGKTVALLPANVDRVLPSRVGQINTNIDKVWVRSEFQREMMLRCGVEASQLSVIPPAIDVSIYRSVSGGLPLDSDGRFRFLFMGELNHDDGFDLTIRAFVDSFRMGDDASLVIAPLDRFGTGQQGTVDQLKATVASWSGIADIQWIREPLSESDRAALLQSCDAFVYPYCGIGDPSVVVEAVAAGLTVIVPEYGSAPEYVFEGSSLLVDRRSTDADVGPEDRYGELYCEPDPVSLAKAIRVSYLNRFEMRLCASSNFERAQSEYSWDRIAAVIEFEINSLREVQTI